MKLSNLEIYTDGACSQNRTGNWHGGYGVYIEQENVKISDGAIDTTNNEMELLAISEALIYISDSLERIKKEYKEIFIYSDSAYLVNGMNDKWYRKWKRNGWLTSKKKPVKNKELWQSIVSHYETIIDSIPVNFIKVPAHNGIQGNEIADELAVAKRKEMRKFDNLVQHKKEAYEALK